jgi:sugar fermentation stimulation protein A
MTLNSIPRSKGVYVLVINISNTVVLNLRIGTYTLKPGYYCYVGSALSHGGLHSRIKHHLRRPKERVWWHIDYLTSRDDVLITHVVFSESIKDLEEVIAEELMKSKCWEPSIKGFGCSDRESYTHLFKCLCSTHECVDEVKEIMMMFTSNPKVLVLTQ